MSPANVAASVKARLQNKAKEVGQAYNEVLQLYAMERFLYRLSQSEHAESFVLKGALLFMVWEPEYQRRTTLDIDLLGFTDNTLGNLEAIARTVCKTSVEDDGIQFDLDNVRVERIKEDADYEGVRIRTYALLERSKVPLQIDIGFGDALVPGAVPATMPTLLDFPAPKLRCYHQLTMIAEKFQAMVKLGELNSRMKDFYDIWNIIQHETISGVELQEACAATFEHRKTPFNLDDDFFSEAFAKSAEKQIQWTAFIRKQGIENIAPNNFEDIVTQLQEFFQPMVEHQIADNIFSATWVADGQWH
jgi:predicted nucleotidyltransferase component of viral defense system